MVERTGLASPERLSRAHKLEARNLDMAKHHLTGQTVTFAIVNRMFGLDRLAKRLNKLVSTGQIGGWHPERWTDWDHTAIQISFDSVEDATFASQLSLETGDELPAAVAPKAIVESASDLGTPSQTN